MISDFSSFFEIFAGLNLAYAGSEEFRHKIDTKFLSLRFKFERIINDREQELELAKSSIGVTENYVIEEHIKKIIRYDNIKLKKIDADLKDKIEFSNLFKSVFLLAGFYCLIFLISSASISNQIHEETHKTLILLISIFTWLYGTIVIGITFSRFNKIKIKAIIPILIILISLFISVFISIYNLEKILEEVTINFFQYFNFDVSTINKTSFIYLALLTAISPYLFHVIRSLFLFRIYGFLMLFSGVIITKALSFEIEKSLVTIVKKDNKKPSFPAFLKSIFAFVVFSIIKLMIDISRNRKKRRRNSSV